MRRVLRRDAAIYPNHDDGKMMGIISYNELTNSNYHPIPPDLAPKYLSSHAKGHCYECGEDIIPSDNYYCRNYGCDYHFVQVDMRYRIVMHSDTPSR